MAKIEVPTFRTIGREILAKASDIKGRHEVWELRLTIRPTPSGFRWDGALMVQSSDGLYHCWSVLADSFNEWKPSLYSGYYSMEYSQSADRIMDEKADAKTHLRWTNADGI